MFRMFQLFPTYVAIILFGRFMRGGEQRSRRGGAWEARKHGGAARAGPPMRAVGAGAGAGVAGGVGVRTWEGLFGRPGTGAAVTQIE
jgi:hypothetical protein